MAENNTIFFKLEEYYDNRGNQELIASTGVKGITSISLNYIKEKNKKGSIINDATETLINVDFVTDDDGYAEIDLTKLLRITAFIKFFQKYKGDVTLSVTMEIPKTDKYNVFVGNVKITPSWKKEESGIIFESYDYYNNDDTIILSPIEDKVTDLATLRQTYKTVEENYLLVKKRYESQIVGEVDLEIDTTETYEPKSLKTVITRLLEFQVGTLQPALEYTKTAKLTTEYDRLNTMDKLINILSKMYPNITIDDGEGIPYDDKKL
jgi:hypothetical protein